MCCNLYHQFSQFAHNRKLHTEVYSRWEMMIHHLPSITQTDEISLHNLAQSESKASDFHYNLSIIYYNMFCN